VFVGWDTDVGVGDGAGGRIGVAVHGDGEPSTPDRACRSTLSGTPVVCRASRRGARWTEVCMAQPVQVGQVGVGGHACLTFTDSDERLDLLAAFVNAAVDGGARVVCYTDAVPVGTLVEELAQRWPPAFDAIERDQLRVLDCAASWLGADPDTAARLRTALVCELEAAVDAGYAGLRASVDMAWATRPHAAAHELLRFEQDLGDALGEATETDRLTVMCQYDRDAFDPVTLAFASDVHAQAVAAQVYHDDPLLRICRQYHPAGIRIAGELDFRNRDALQQAVAETLRLDGQPFVNLRRVRILDAACAAVLLQAAEQLPAGRVMQVLCGPLPAAVLRICGAPGIPGLRVRRDT
jgi:anti-anti-sigma regulatory factor